MAARRPRDGAHGLQAAAAHRRRDHQQGAHGGEDRAALQRTGRPRPRRQPRRAGHQQPVERRTGKPASLQATARRIREGSAPQHAGQQAKLLSARSRPRQRAEAEVRRSAEAGVHRRRSVVGNSRRSKRFRSGTPAAVSLGPRAVHRLVAVLPHLGIARRLSGDLRARETRRAGAASCLPTRRTLLDKIVATKLLTARGVYGFFPANSRGRRRANFTPTSSRSARSHRRSTSCASRSERADGTPNWCLADFIAPERRADGGSLPDHLGAFAVTAGHGLEGTRRSDFKAKPRRLQRHHGRGARRSPGRSLRRIFCTSARARTGATAQGEKLATDELIAEKYRGIRPARRLSGLSRPHRKSNLSGTSLDAEKHTGITLTENFAMYPGASVSGSYFAHPDLQILRRGVSLAATRSWTIRRPQGTAIRA